MSNLKQKHKDYLIKNEIKDLTDLVNYVEILRNTSNLQGEDRQMLFDFAFLIVNEQSSLKSFFAENFRQELHNQLGITNNNVNVKSSDSLFTKTSDIIDEINKMGCAPTPSKEFYNAFKKVAEDEDKAKWVRANFYHTLGNSKDFIEVCEFLSLEDAKKYFNNSTNTEAFYYKYGTKELIEKEEKIKPSPTFMDEVLEQANYDSAFNEGFTSLKKEDWKALEENRTGTATEVPKFYNYLDFQLPQYPNLEERNKAIEDSFKNTIKVLTGEANSGDTFKSGKKETEGKLNYELDWEFIQQLAERMSQNKGKYKPYNWMQPIDVEKLKQSLFRHVVEVMKGNYEDDGRTFGHLESISANVMMINYQLKNSVK